jgi:hypothetical protein
MARNRKTKTKTPAQDPLPNEDLEIPDNEKWRLITESGVLGQTTAQTGYLGEDEEDIPLGEEIFNATLLIIPMSFLLLMMEMCVDSVTLKLLVTEHKSWWKA